MTFEQILPHLRAGKVVRRKGWPQSFTLRFKCDDYSQQLEETWGRVGGPSVTKQSHGLGWYDLSAIDWEVVEDERNE